MNTETIIRAWKDPEFRASLSLAQRQELPECPSGRPLTELDDGDLGDVIGGLVIRPTPPVYNTHGFFCVTKGSAYDACPSALLCPTPPILELANPEAL